MRDASAVRRRVAVRAGVATRRSGCQIAGEVSSSVVRLQAFSAPTEPFGHCGVFASFRNLSGQHEALRFVVEGDGGAGWPCCSVPAGCQSVFDQVGLKVWCLGAPEGLEIGFEEFFRCAVEYFDGDAGIESDVSYGVALSPAGLEDAVFQVDRRLAGHIVGMDRDVSFGASVFDPMDGAMVVSLGAGHPDVAMLALDPTA